MDGIKNISALVLSQCGLNVQIIKAVTSPFVELSHLKRIEFTSLCECSYFKCKMCFSEGCQLL